LRQLIPAASGEREFALAAEAGFHNLVTTCYGPVLTRHRRSTCELPRVAAGDNVDFGKFDTAVVNLVGTGLRSKPRR
jgi:hypothetical protein